MTIIDAINTAIEQLEGMHLAVRDTDNITRVQTALNILDALKDAATRQTGENKEQEPAAEITEEAVETDE